MNTTRTVVDHVILFQICFAGFSQGTFRLNFSQPIVTQRTSHTVATWLCLQCLQVWVGSSSSWGLQHVWRFLLCHLQESNFCFLPEKTAVNHVTKQGTRPFLQGALIGFKFNFNSSRLSHDIQSPGVTLSTITFQTKTWLIKPHRETGAIWTE